MVWGVLIGAGPSAASDLAALLDAAGVSRHVAEWPEANASAREEARETLKALLNLDPEFPEAAGLLEDLEE